MSRHAARRALFLATLATLGMAVGGDARAFERNISFCNRTERDVDVAIGFDRTGTAETTSKGWFKVRNCSCRSI